MSFSFLNRKAKTEDLIEWNARSHHVGIKNPVHLKQTDTMAKAIEDMHFFGKRRLPVTDRDGTLKGIITSSDVLEFLSARKALKTPVNNIMNSAWSVEHWSSLSRTLGLFHRYRKGGYPVVLKDGKLTGIITDYDIIKGINKKMGITVEKAMTQKPVVAREGEPIIYASRMMSRGFRRMPVTRNGIITGIITPHDVINHLKTTGRIAGLRDSDRIVKNIMVRDVVTIEPKEDVHKALQLMKRNRVGGLPVAEDHELIGIITERDIVDLFRP